MRKITLFIMLISVLEIFAQNRIKTNLLEENFDAGIPSTWTIENHSTSGGAVWTGATDYDGYSLDGTPFAFVDSDTTGEGKVADTELISPEVDASAANTLFISFNHFFRTYQWGEKADVDVFDGNDWVTVYTAINSLNGFIEDANTWNEPAFRVIDVSAYKNAKFKVRFHYYDAEYEYYWAVDNVKIYEAVNVDLAVVEANPGTFNANEDFSLDATILNLGSDQQEEFDVTFDIVDDSNNSVYNETVNVTNASLKIGEKYVVTPGKPNLPIGKYTLTVTLSSTNDLYPSNNTYTKTINIVDYSSSYQTDSLYSYSLAEGTFLTFNNEGTPNYLNDSEMIYFPDAGTFINDLLVAIEFRTNKIYFIDGNGNTYYYRKLTGDIGQNVALGIAYDTALGKSYITSGMELYELNFSNLSTTLVGPLNAAGLVIGIDFDSNGVLYGVDIILSSSNTWEQSNLYSIDTTTGLATSITQLDASISGILNDISINPGTNELYGTFAVDKKGAGLYRIDKLNGKTTLIGTSTDTDQFSVCASKGSFTSISKNQIEGLKVFPNPTNGIIFLQAKENILNISITDMTGKEILSVNNNNMQAKVDLNKLPIGNYIMKIVTNKTIGTKHIIKK